MRYGEFTKEIGAFKLLSSGGAPAELYLKIDKSAGASGFQLTVEEAHDLRYGLDRFLAAYEQDQLEFRRSAGQE